MAAAGDGRQIESVRTEVLASWRELAARLQAPPYLQPGWFRAFWDAFGPERPVLATVRRGDRLVAVLPLNRVGWGFEAPANWHTPAFAPLAVDEPASRELAATLLAARPGRVRLGFVTADDPVGGGCRRLGARVRLRALQRSPYLAITGEWSAYESGLDPRLRRELRRCGRRLGERGPVTVQVADGRTGLAELLDEGLRVEGSGWKLARATAIASSPKTRRFYTALADWAAGAGLLRLAFLRLAGRPIAFDFALEQAGVHYLLKTGYDPEFRSFGPGQLLRAEMLRRAFEQDLRRYEFGGDAEPWKLAWTRSVDDLWEAEVHPRSMVGTAALLAGGARRLGAEVGARVTTRLRAGDDK